MCKKLLITLLLFQISYSVKIYASISPIFPIFSTSFGVTNGSYSDNLHGVVKIQTHYENLNIWEGSPDTSCTGALIGLNPPTVITADHCVRHWSGKIGRVQVIYKDHSGYKKVGAKIIYKTKREQRKIFSDLAFLILDIQGEESNFGIKEQEIFHSLSRSVTLGEEIEYCGFSMNQRLKCAKNQIFSINDKISEWSDLSKMDSSDTKKLNDEKLKISGHVSMHINYEKDPMIATSLFKDGLYFENAPMLEGGDSGGPWFIRNGNRLELLGITSGTQSDGFIMSDGNGDLINFAAPLNTQFAKDFFREAAEKGADVGSFGEL